jgi:DinB superfamily
MTRRPARSEAPPYYFTYIDQVPAGEICATLAAQAGETTAILREVSDERSLYRYADDKWSLREVLGHINDCERLFVGRAFWFARGFETPLPSFDQHVANAHSDAHNRQWKSHVEEFTVVRESTLAFFSSLPKESWDRRGIASDNPFTVRALAFITAGHAAHHMAIVKARYLSVRWVG